MRKPKVERIKQLVQSQMFKGKEGLIPSRGILKTELAISFDIQDHKLENILFPTSIITDASSYMVEWTINPSLQFIGSKINDY